MEIIRFDESVIKNLKNVEKTIYDTFGEDDVFVFAALDDKRKLGFVVRSNENCLYIDSNGKSTRFTIDENELLSLIEKEGYVINFNEELTFLDSNNIMHFLRLHKYDTLDSDGYDGSIEYKQFDSKRDIMCVITYQQMYHEIDGRAPIYEIRTKEIDGVYIDEKYSKSKGYIKGLPLPKRSKYYTKVAFEDGEAGYDWIKIKDYGLVEFMANRTVTTSRNREVRYVKSSYVNLDGSYGDLWPFAHQMKREEIDEIIKSYGFNTQVPSLLINVYNGYDDTVKDIQEIVIEMKRALSLLKTEENSDLGALLKFVKE